jgi:hypothetical protein
VTRSRPSRRDDVAGGPTGRGTGPAAFDQVPEIGRRRGLPHQEQVVKLVLHEVGEAFEPPLVLRPGDITFQPRRGRHTHIEIIRHALDLAAAPSALLLQVDALAHVRCSVQVSRFSEGAVVIRGFDQGLLRCERGRPDGGLPGGRLGCNSWPLTAPVTAGGGSVPVRWDRGGVSCAGDSRVEREYTRKYTVSTAQPQCRAKGVASGRHFGKS